MLEYFSLGTVFHDTEELSQALRHTNVSAMQTSRGKFKAALAHISAGDWSLQYLSFEEGASACAGDAPRDRYAFLVPFCHVPQCRLLGQPVTDTSIGVYAPGSEHADATSMGCEQVVIVASQDWVARSAMEGLALRKEGSGLASIDLAALTRLRGVLREIQTASVPSAASQRILCDALHSALSDVMRQGSDNSRPAGPGRPRMPRSVIVRRILELLDAKRSEPLLAGEIAAAVGISQPSLQRVFHELFGMPPARYLAIRRLNLAHQSLRSGTSGSVTEVASSLGFWEFSRFSKAYKSLFNELPSQTLRDSSRCGSDTRPASRQSIRQDRS